MPDPKHNSTIDLRSDTVTKPTQPMLDAMMRAKVGDDVLGDDPTINALQDRCAELFGKAAACFVPSGTMANLLAIRSQTEPGDEIICHPESHIYHYETGGYAAVAGCSIRFAPGERGVFDANTMESLIRWDDDHCPRTRLVSMENTHNRGRGRVWPIEQLHNVCQRAHARGLRTHIDGARIWNASIASGNPVRQIVQHADTVSACFSKGLGAPVGSIVCGEQKTIARVRHLRKMLGGAMRQSGVLAAAAMYALDHHINRLADDHANAQRFADGIDAIDGLTVDRKAVETNLVYFDLDASLGAARNFLKQSTAAGVLMLDEGLQTVRAVTHLHITRAMVDDAVARIASCVSALRQVGGAR
ncbi:MAG: aminotransferase class I/II-fold pyridoxal phosphate-dependent enzyme [Phycisphaerales bacterium]|nr:aminotransferase class I/II-fold pyridoxal phosphate-dependent enzyme [Phycisphaerales bacterium]